MDKREYEEQWPGLPINYLIVASDDYIVFLDHENDIDWKTSDEFDARELTSEDKNKYFAVKNEIDSAETIAINHIDDKVVIAFKRQLGEALVRVFEGEYENASNMVKLAQDYILKRNIEQSRYMFLMSCGSTTLIAILVSVLFWLFRGSIISIIGNTVFYVALASLCGSIGALLSVILRTGKTTLDYNASKKLHIIEGVSRIIAGIISGLIVAVSIKTGIILPIFTKIESTNIAMLLGGLVAGASERFAPSIISKLDGVNNSKSNKKQ
ncbi:MAG TPA: hypothetical protein GX005_00400 [Bacteroidales bacterium]|nr:hypothetical protein [Bacteroidales bacterium]